MIRRGGLISRLADVLRLVLGVVGIYVVLKLPDDYMVEVPLKVVFLLALAFGYRML